MPRNALQELQYTSKGVTWKEKLEKALQSLLALLADFPQAML